MPLCVYVCAMGVGQQMRDARQCGRIARYFLSYWTAIEGGVVPPSPLDPSSPLILSNNLCTLPLVTLAQALANALSHGPHAASTPQQRARTASDSSAHAASSVHAASSAHAASSVHTASCLHFIPPNLGDMILIVPDCHTAGTHTPHAAGTSPRPISTQAASPKAGRGVHVYVTPVCCHSGICLSRPCLCHTASILVCLTVG